MNVYLGQHLPRIMFVFLVVFAMLKLKIEQVTNLLPGPKCVLWDILLERRNYMIWRVKKYL